MSDQAVIEPELDLAVVEPAAPRPARAAAKKAEHVQLEAIVAAVSKSTAVIEFDMDGRVLSANDNFLGVMGYSLDEIKGQHHSLFLDAEAKASDDYRAFWDKLKRGEYQSGEYKRLAKGARPVWIQASYNPILDAKGNPAKVVKFASDVTQQKVFAADAAGQIEAIARSTAVIEFNMDGTIRTANDIFLTAMGYRLDEIKGQHHSMFVEPGQQESAEYREFWEKLRRGEFQAAEYKRLGKNGKVVWIQASYNPILDLNGKPFKVVKYATDVTQQKLDTADATGQIASISKSQAIIEFEMDGRVISANQNFLDVMGYTLEEVQGHSHSMFVEADHRASDEYRDFWERLRRGEYQAAVYKRMGKGGREVWIQASYNPILDLNGKPFKVVKYATEVTEHIRAKIDLQEKVEVILRVVRAASKGDLTQEISLKGDDAIGQMGEGLAEFFMSLRQSVGLILRNAQAVGQSAEKLMGISQEMARNAGETASQAEVVSAASGEVSDSVSTMAASGEEMLMSIKLIAKSSHDSAQVAKEAVGAAETANRTISELGDSSVKIGNVIKVITSIAQQTNLLALNATIEAARAGEAGKGFAVVAHEVKELAKQTAKATDEIGSKIEAIQTSTTSAVAAIAQIDSVIKQIDEISASIASAVEEQTATTNEMGRNVKAASCGVGDIANSIGGVARTAQNTTVAANETQQAAKALADLAAQLQSVMAGFKI